MHTPGTSNSVSSSAQDGSVICVFESPLLFKLGDVAFRATDTDRKPIVVIPMGATVAILGLAALQQELGIASDSPDGRMLAMVTRALDFVEELRPGDPLPMEILCGDASWQPNATQQRAAAARITLQLTALLGECRGPDADAVSAAWASADFRDALTAASNPGLALQMRDATNELASLLGLPDAAAATQILKELTHELSFIEALRARLLDRATRVYDQLEVLRRQVRTNASSLELVSRVRRLVGIGISRIRARFAGLEARSADLLVLLRDFEPCRIVIRAQRDWLYCSLRAWEGVLTGWETASPDWSNDTKPLLKRTYRFLAPRFMPIQEWMQLKRAGPADDELRTRMVW